MSVTRSVRLGDLIEDISAGVSLQGENRPPTSGEVGILTLSALSGTHLDPTACKAVSRDLVPKLGPSPQAGTILISRSNTPDLVGSCVYVESDIPDRYLPDLIWEIKIRPDVQCDGRWLTEYLRSSQGRRNLLRAAAGTSGSMIKLSMDRLRRLRVMVPPVDVQEAVVTSGSHLDRIAATLSSLIATKGTFKRGLMQQLLTGRKRFPQHDGQPWRKVSLGEMCTLVNGHVFREEDWTTEGLPIIRIANLNGSPDFDYFSGDPDPAWTIRSGDLLFAWSGTRGTSFGPFIWRSGTAVLNQHIFKVTPRAGVDKLWFYQMLRFLTVQIERRAHGGSGIVHVRKSDLERQEVLLPTLAEQQCIAHVLQLAESEVDQLIHLRELFDRQKSALLSRLHLGEISVSPS